MILLDTNVLSELRKGARADSNVRSWFENVPAAAIHLSVLVVGEINRGIELIRRRDPTAATALDGWLATIERDHRDRILDVTLEVVETWARFNVPDPLPVIDSLLAATAHVHALTLATRNVKDIARTGVPVVNPFDPA
ncbi:MAG: type II toxin-antitoxin system VapC family toxin [Nannocystaceae bacterium]|nr:type II toxin-antitoxin system VapC family toxin [bacterium]